MVEAVSNVREQPCLFGSLERFSCRGLAAPGGWSGHDLCSAFFPGLHNRDLTFTHAAAHKERSLKAQMLCKRPYVINTGEWRGGRRRLPVTSHVEPDSLMVPCKNAHFPVPHPSVCYGRMYEENGSASAGSIICDMSTAYRQ